MPTLREYTRLQELKGVTHLVGLRAGNAKLSCVLLPPPSCLPDCPSTVYVNPLGISVMFFIRFRP